MLGRMSPGREAEGRTRWRRPSGWVTVPSFSAWVSSGKRTSALALVAFSCIEKQTTKSAAVIAASQALVSGKSRSGSTPKRIRPLSSPDSSAARISSVGLPTRGAFPAAEMLSFAEARAGVGQAAGLAQAAGVGGVGDFEEAGAVGACASSAAASSSRAAAPLPSRATRSPQRTTTLPASRRLSASGVATFSAPPTARGQLADEVGGLAGGVAGDRLGAAVERGRALGRDRQAGAVAADRLADAQVEDRRAVQRVGAEDEDHVGVVDVARPGPRRWAGRAGPVASRPGPREGRESMWGEPSASRRMLLDQEALLVGGVADDRRDLAAAGRAQALGRGLDRLAPSVAAPPLSRGPSTRSASANISKP